MSYWNPKSGQESECISATPWLPVPSKKQEKGLQYKDTVSHET